MFLLRSLEAAFHVRRRHLCSCVARQLGFPLPPNVCVRLPLQNAPQVAEGAITKPSGVASSDGELSFDACYLEAEFDEGSCVLGLAQVLVRCVASVSALAERSHHRAHSSARSVWQVGQAGCRDPSATRSREDHQGRCDGGGPQQEEAAVQLLREIIEAEGYADKDLGKDTHRGFDLVGNCPASGVLPGKLVPVTLQERELQCCARKMQASLKVSLGSSGDCATDLELWGKAMAEVKEGWQQGH